MMRVGTQGIAYKNNFCKKQKVIIQRKHPGCIVVHGANHLRVKLMKQNGGEIHPHSRT